MKALVPQGGQTVYYSYDDLGRLYGVQTGTNVYSYTYLDNSNLVQSLLRPNGSVTDYSYNDPLRRLTEVQNKKLNQQLINGYAYAYDNQDLISSETVTNGNPIPTFTAGLVTSSFDNVNRLMSTTNPDMTFAYDNDANLTRGYTPEGYVLNMQYDSENRIVSAEYTDSIGKIHKTEYAYTGDGLLARVKKYENGVLIKETRFVRAGFLPIQERDGTNAVKKEFTWGAHRGGGIGGLLNLRQAGSDYSYLYDGRGNVTSLLDNLQNVVATYSYDSYGTLMNKTGSIDQPFMFSTKQYDTETGLQYFGYRFYNPAMGRWLTRDPLGEVGGLNLYSFVGNNPVNWVDPLGLWTVTPRVNFTFIFADVTLGVALDDKSNIGLQFTAAAGLSLSVGITGGVTVTNAPCISNLEGPGTSAGFAANISGIFPGFGAEVNHVWTGWPNRYDRPGVYKGIDVGAGFGIGLNVTPQGFTGSTVTLFQGRY
jgi:RHS repeat-associated protein